MSARVEHLQEKLRHKDVDALLVMQPENRRYLSGFTGTAGALVVARQNIYFLADFRYFEQAKQECPGWEIREIKDSTFDSVVDYLPEWKILRLGYEDNFLTHKQFKELEDRLQAIMLVPLAGVVEELRQTKEEAEVEIIKKAAELADQAFQHVVDFIRPGVTEREIALEVEFFMRRRGARKASFEFIVASGPRGAMPHGVASNKTLQEGELVTLDYGCEYEGYCSDFTRTVSLGSPAARQEQIYRIVLEAQKAGLASIRAGVKACEVDEAVRRVIGDYNYSENFRHSSGHGVGLTVHEGPQLSKKDETILKAGMVLTVEPGIYLPGWGGVRIEDMVLLEEEGFRLLTRAPRDYLVTCGVV
ncbi:MAG TPA: Xaa-Pro dipeptidase [Desulfotomaculum sp.]|nr:Xaa-Pro dipeptidase [Desulfotomaculum sp.]